ncbi:hypothetical protein D931_01652 [Enterococcus faecium 13.SD.W.09]|nr:hypothetical protein D931_01786 [Enterococcus faecium 13.SD.W.09]EPH64615.1 hypothetical protein D931_01652 [Enterococcus faecium 13.SD.W.09]
MPFIDLMCFSLMQKMDHTWNERQGLTDGPASAGSSCCAFTLVG